MPFRIYRLINHVKEDLEKARQLKAMKRIRVSPGTSPCVDKSKPFLSKVSKVLGLKGRLPSKSQGRSNECRESPSVSKEDPSPESGHPYILSHQDYCHDHRNARLEFQRRRRVPYTGAEIKYSTAVKDKSSRKSMRSAEGTIWLHTIYEARRQRFGDPNGMILPRVRASQTKQISILPRARVIRFADESRGDINDINASKGEILDRFASPVTQSETSKYKSKITPAGGTAFARFPWTLRHDSAMAFVASPLGTFRGYNDFPSEVLQKEPFMLVTQLWQA